MNNDALDRAFVAALLQNAGLTPAAAVVRALDGVDEPLDVSVHADAPFPPASTIKVPIVASLVAAWTSGPSTPEDRFVIEPADMTANDAPSPLVPGYEATLAELGWGAIVRSDNVATNALIRYLGREHVTADCATWGLGGTAVRRLLSGSLPLIDDPEATGRNAHPAADAAELYTRIAFGVHWTGTFLLDALEAQVWNEKLPRGLRPGDRFAHKTGDTDEVSHDGGILTLPDRRRFVVVVHTGLPSSPEHDTRFGRFMAALREALD